MATLRHPETGVPMNDISVKRKNIDGATRHTIFLLRLQGDTIEDIARKLGLDRRRVSATLRRRGEMRAARAAIIRLKANGELLL